MIVSPFLMCVAHVQSTQNKKFEYPCNISRKTWWIFCFLINAKVFYMLIVSFWMCIARYVQSIQNNDLAISLQYINENVTDEVNFLPAGTYQRFLQIDTIILGVCVCVCVCVCVSRHAQITENIDFTISL